MLINNDFVNIKSCNIDTISYVNSIYSFILIIMLNKGCDNILFIFNKDFFSKLKNKPKNYIIENSSPSKLRRITKKSNNIIYNKRCIFYSELINILGIKKYQGSDHESVFLFFCGIENLDFEVIEDGLINYSEFNCFRDLIKKKINIMPYGCSSIITKIWLTGLRPILFNDSRNKKIEYFNLDKENSNNFEKIVNFYFKVPSFFCSTEPKTLLLTQPLSEDLYITEQQKIRIYKDIINNSQGEVFIKPHPREKTEYSEIFKNCIVLDNDFPCEILFVKYQFNYIKTLFSTGAYIANILSPSSVISILGVTNIPKLVKRFGYIKPEILK